LLTTVEAVTILLAASDANDHLKDSLRESWFVLLEMVPALSDKRGAVPQA
jgi:hypothetical protein